MRKLQFYRRLDVESWDSSPDLAIPKAYDLFILKGGREVKALTLSTMESSLSISPLMVCFASILRHPRCTPIKTRAGLLGELNSVGIPGDLSFREAVSLVVSRHMCQIIQGRWSPDLGTTPSFKNDKENPLFYLEKLRILLFRKKSK